MPLSRLSLRRLRFTLVVIVLLTACVPSTPATPTAHPVVSPTNTLTVTSTSATAVPPTPTSLLTAPTSSIPLQTLPDSPVITSENAWALQRHDVVLGRFHFSPTMEHLLWVKGDETEIIDAAEMRLLFALPSDSNISFSPDSRRITWVAGEGTIGVRDLTGDADDLMLEGFSDECCIHLRFSPDGSRILVIDLDPSSQSGYERIMKLIDWQEGETILSIEGSEWAEFSQDGRLLGVQELYEIGASVWNTDRAEKLYTISGFSTAAPFYGIRFEPDMDSVAMWARAGGELFDVSTGEKRFDFIGVPMNFSPLGGTLATSETGWMSSECTGTVCLYDTATGEIRRILMHDGVVWDLEYSPSGELLVADGGDHVRLWNPVNGAKLAHLPVDYGDLWSVGFSADGRYIMGYAHGNGGGSHLTGIWAVNPAATVTRIAFDPGATLWTGEIPAMKGEIQRYALRAMQGQTMQVVVRGSGTHLKIRGEDGSELSPSSGDYNFWRGTLPVTQDYYIDLSSRDEEWVPDELSLYIAIAPRGQDEQAFSYRDPEGRFAVEYPDYFFVNPQPYSISGVLGRELLRLDFVDSSFYEGTNLTEALVNITRSDDPSVVGSCSDQMLPNEQFQGSETLNRQPYSKWVGLDLAMGHLYGQTSYRTVVGNACYQITLHESSVDPDLFREGEIIEYDTVELTERFRSLVQSIDYSE